MATLKAYWRMFINYMFEGIGILKGIVITIGLLWTILTTIITAVYILAYEDTSDWSKRWMEDFDIALDKEGTTKRPHKKHKLF